MTAAEIMKTLSSVSPPQDQHLSRGTDLPHHDPLGPGVFFIQNPELVRSDVQPAPQARMAWVTDSKALPKPTGHQCCRRSDSQMVTPIATLPERREEKANAVVRLLHPPPRGARPALRVRGMVCLLQWREANEILRIQCDGPTVKKDRCFIGKGEAPKNQGHPEVSGVIEDLVSCQPFADSAYAKGIPSIALCLGGRAPHQGSEDAIEEPMSLLQKFDAEPPPANAMPCICATGAIPPDYVDASHSSYTEKKGPVDAEGKL
ncbi:ryanodine receptor 1-like protein [Lates japonicus]|uniref:Ryanodine receptor 1-like protein n=1 Tax=Lates japonicus TaxID=270547 RepID=A0AAD3NMU4_LATJO|nr:ryanodine receptor 1-like protein [Lates japonicus]